jgi:hypothetical protein
MSSGKLLDSYKEDKIMTLKLLKHPEKFYDEDVRIYGRVLSVRKHKNYSFVDVFNKYNVLLALHEIIEDEKSLKWPYRGHIPTFQLLLHYPFTKLKLKKLSIKTIK